jgi:hypothetical protein
MPMLATHTSSTLCTVSCDGPPRSTRLATPTTADAPAPHRQPPLIAKPSTAPAVQIDGRVFTPCSIRSAVSTHRVSRIPASATSRSTVRNSRVHRAADSVRVPVVSVQAVSSAR